MTLRNERVRKELMRDISDILRKEIRGLAGVVSVLDRELFLSQPKELKETILGKNCRVVVAEAGISLGWESLVSSSTDLFCLKTFGASGPGEKVAEYFGFTADKLAEIL